MEQVTRGASSLCCSGKGSTSWRNVFPCFEVFGFGARHDVSLGFNPGCSGTKNCMEVFSILSYTLSIMNPICQKIAVLFSLSLAFMATGVCQNTNKERLAMLPFTVEGLSSQEGLQLQQRFTAALDEQDRFDILSGAAQRNALEQAGLRTLDSCNTLPCLAQLGKVLNVQKIVHVKGLHAGRHYILQIRLVDADDAKLLYDDTIDYSGDFGQPLSDAIADQAAKITRTYFSAGIPWYYVAAAVLVGVGGLYWLFSAWASSASSDSGNSSSTSTTH